VPISRRKFVGVGAAAAAGIALNREARGDIIASGTTDPIIRDFAGPPVVVSSANGIRGVARAYSAFSGARFPLENAVDALKLIDGRGATGKVVLDVAAD